MKELFDFRFNELTAQGGVNQRRTQKIPNFGTRTVFDVVCPVMKVPVFNEFPYQVCVQNVEPGVFPVAPRLLPLVTPIGSTLAVLRGGGSTPSSAFCL